jgi:hypothetical protein
MHLNKKTCLLVVTLLIAGGNFAQMSFEAGVSTLIGFSKSKSFAAYRDYYNTANATSLKNNLGSASFNYGYDARIEFSMGKYYSAVSLTNIYANCSAKFENDATRKFQLNQRYVNILIGYTNKNETSEFTIATGISVSNYFVTTHVKYPNGDKDYTYGVVFGSNQTVAIGVPLLVEYGINLSGRWSLVARAQAQFSTKDNFTFFSNTGSVVYPEGEIAGDAFRGFLSIGLKRKFNF